ncbi:type II toxin-antitoxin system Phd/YefM family antitoxin [Streptomyces sp. SLBN-31]|uniref:type II toxin-antitoxin system Phd/YefM family antitoxin n=1 Tax=Streptomyces sp. SLBN-31 TaxID=2768444 RepID=UPI0021B4858D|nr:type II toxin-antitoxin system prevent-host-death family antitoxin [Streptomyces sp. SLBN-31]
MEITARDFDRKSSQILAAAARGETVTVTKNGTPGATGRADQRHRGAPVPDRCHG